MTKRLIALFLMLAMMLTMLVACQNGEEGDATEAPTGDATVAETEAPEQPTEAPEQPTEAPEQPTEAPEQPTEAPEQPTDAPEEPTEAPEQPTDAPEQPTEPEETKPADGIYDLDADKACFAAKSFDECEAWNGEAELVKFFTPGQAASLPEIVDIPSESTAVRFWGWIGTTQDIIALGYRIDTDAPVFGDQWFHVAEDGVVGAVTGAGGSFATRFNIKADVSAIPSGEHTLTALYKLADGTKVAICSVKVNIGYRKAVLGDISRSLTTDVNAQSDFASSDLSGFFDMELPINQCGVGDGLYTLAGIVDFKTKVDGQYSMLVKDFWTQGINGSYMVVRGVSYVHSVDVPAGETHIDIEGGDHNFYPITNFYETDGCPEENSCGGAGICISYHEDGRLVVTIKRFDPDWPSRVRNSRFTYMTDNSCRDILVTDDNSVVEVYNGKKLIVSIALDGSVDPVDYSGLQLIDDVHFAKTATLTGFDGSVNVVENTLVVDCAAGEIGMAARAATVRFSAINVKPLSKTVLPGQPTYIVGPEFMMDQVNGGTGSTTNNTDAVLGDGFITLTSNGGDPYVAVVNLGANAPAARYAALKYRTTGIDSGEFFIGSEGGWHGQTDEVVYKYINDGEWHLLVVDLTASASFTNTSLAAYCRLDYFLGNGGSIDVAYFGFFESEEDAQMYFDKTMPAPAPEVDWNNVKLEKALTIDAGELGVAGFTRGAAFSPDGKYFFAGVLNASPNNVTMIDVATGKKVAYLTFEGNAFAKGLAVDDRGYLYVGLANYDSKNDVYLEVYKIDYDALTLTQVARLCVCEEADKAMRVNGLAVGKDGNGYSAYLFSDKQNVMFKLDVTDAAAPAVIGSIAMDESFYMDMYNGNAVIASKGDKISVVNGEAVLQEITVTNAYAVGVYDNYALVAPKNGAPALTVIDLTNCETVATVTTAEDFSAGSQFVFVKVCGDTLFVVVQNDTILSAKLF